MNRYADDGLSDQDAPRRKLAMGLVALAAVLAFGLCLDAVACSRQGGGKAPAENPAAPALTTGAATTGGMEEDGTTVVNGVTLLDADKLSGFDDTMVSSLAAALKSYASSNGLDPKSARFRVTGGSATSADAMAKLAVVGTDTRLTATLGQTGWTVDDGSGASSATTTASSDEVSVSDAERLKPVFGDDTAKLKSDLKAFLDSSAPGSDVESATIGSIGPVPGSDSSSFAVKAGAAKVYGTYDPVTHAFSFSLAQ